MGQSRGACGDGDVGRQTFFNFNPLIKLDGYYLLSDVFGIANLRSKSFRYVGDFINEWRIAGRLPDVPPREDGSFCGTA
jgi:hypothetical protein